MGDYYIIISLYIFVYELVESSGIRILFHESGVDLQNFGFIII